MMVGSCKEFDGLPATPENMERAKGCLRMAYLYVDKTVDPPLLRYLERDDGYEIIGWKRVNGKVYYVIRLKDGRIRDVPEDRLDDIDALIKAKRELERLKRKKKGN
jgi:hypothetical protein